MGEWFLEYRRATRNDIDLFAQNRIEFVTSIRSISDIEEFERRTKEYLIDNIESDNAIIFIATENNNIAASCMACVYKTAPSPGCLTGQTAQLLNVYTKEEFRKKGHAKKLLKKLIDELKSLKIEKVLLEYTSDGRALYEKMGFTLLENQMQLKLK